MLPRCRLLGPLTVLFALTLLAGCSAEPNSSDSPSASSQQDEDVLSLSNSDVMFLQMMIPHHRQAVDISNLALSKSSNTELLALAQRISEEQGAEIEMMRGWLQAAGEDEEMGHAMHGMDGMLSDEALSQLEQAEGSAFDRAWLNGMIEHHDGAIEMAEMIVDARDERLRAFGEQIIAAQSAEIDEMKSILANLG